MWPLTLCSTMWVRGDERWFWGWWREERVLLVWTSPSVQWTTVLLESYVSWGIIVRLSFSLGESSSQHESAAGSHCLKIYMRVTLHESWIMNLEILAQNNVCTDLCTDTDLYTWKEHTKIAQFHDSKKLGQTRWYVKLRIIRIIQNSWQPLRGQAILIMQVRMLRDHLWTPCPSVPLPLSLSLCSPVPLFPCPSSSISVPLFPCPSSSISVLCSCPFTPSCFVHSAVRLCSLDADSDLCSNWNRAHHCHRDPRQQCCGKDRTILWTAGNPPRGAGCLSHWWHSLGAHLWWGWWDKPHSEFAMTLGFGDLKWKCTIHDARVTLLPSLPPFPRFLLPFPPFLLSLPSFLHSLLFSSPFPPLPPFFPLPLPPSLPSLPSLISSSSSGVCGVRTDNTFCTRGQKEFNSQPCQVRREPGGRGCCVHNAGPHSN